MVKYFITLALLACAALECTNLNNRMFAKSEVNKPTHHHLRPQKYGSFEANDHNAYREHQHHNDRHPHPPHPHPHLHPHHHLSHNLHHQHLESVDGDQHLVNRQNQEIDFEDDQEKTEAEAESETDIETDTDEDKFKNKPNLWYIVNKELSKASIRSTNEDDYVDAVNNDQQDESDMLRDGFSEVNDNDLDVSPELRPRQHRQHHHHQQQQLKAAPTIKCPKCESNRQNVRVSEEELTRLRIEFVKRQILEKLRLKDKPNVSAVGMPKPIYEETTIHQDEPTSSKDLDDYYARARKKFIFLEREKQECNHLSQPSICFSFKIDDLDLESIDVSKAVLWIFKRRNSKDLLKQTIVVSEVEQGGHNSKYLPKVKPIAIQSVDVQEGWMKIDIEWPIKRWFGIHELSHLIHISCQSCEIKTADSFISTEKDYRPFIMIDTQNRRRVSRQKRSVNCTNGVTECCREKLYISFDEIGWGDWIISPRGYDAYFCRGSCSTAASIAQSTTHHSSLMRKVISHRDTAGKKPLELIPCCTANQYSSLEIFFRDSNNTATLMKFPNMVIESCGCM